MVDVLVLGEVLVELSAAEMLERADTMRLGFSGDALNSAAAAAAAGAGAHVQLLTRVADDELGHRLLERVAQLGIDASAIELVPGAQHGVYFVGADPDGQREFVYVRRGSAASGMAPDSLERAADAAVTLCSGITCAVSGSAARTVLAAAERARAFVYDPNFCPRLTIADAAAVWLRRLAPHARLVLPSCPGETEALLGTADAMKAARVVRQAGAAAVAVTSGPNGVLVDDGEQTWIPVVPPVRVVDQTGAGDVFAGTVTAPSLSATTCAPPPGSGPPPPRSACRARAAPASSRHSPRPGPISDQLL